MGIGSNRGVRGLGLALVVGLGLSTALAEAAECGPALAESGEPAVRTLETDFLAKRRPETLLLLAQAAKAAGRGLDAVNLLRVHEALRHRPVPGLAAAAQRLAIDTLPTASELLIFGGEAMTEAIVRVDGRVLGLLPRSSEQQLQLLVPPGSHCLSLQKESERSDIPIDLGSGRPWEVRFRDSGIVTVQPTPRLALVLSGLSLPRTQVSELRRIVASAAFPELSLRTDNEAVTIPGAELTPFLMPDPCQDHSYAKTQYVLRVTVTPPTGSQRGLQLEVLHTATGTPTAESREPCGRCEGVELLDQLKRLLPALLQQARQRDHGCLAVRTQPGGAEVRVSPVVESFIGPPSVPLALGETPTNGWLRRALLSGPYEVTLYRPGYQPIKRRVELGEGHTPLEATLAPTIAPSRISNSVDLNPHSAVPEPPKVPLYKQWWLWQAVAVATSITVAGVVSAVTVNR